MAKDPTSCELASPWYVADLEPHGFPAEELRSGWETDQAVGADMTPGTTPLKGTHIPRKDPVWALPWKEKQGLAREGLSLPKSSGCTCEGSTGSRLSFIETRCMDAFLWGWSF